MDKILEYLLQEKKMSQAAAEKTAQKLRAHGDIYAEFEEWLDRRGYRTEAPLMVGGYTARDIFALAPFLDGIGVFNFMVTLREAPERAQAYIDSGFARK